MVVFTLLHSDRPGLEIELFVSEPFDFDEAFRRSVRVRILGQTVPIAALADLIALKRSSGRHLDLADVEALEEISRRIGPEGTGQEADG